MKRRAFSTLFCLPFGLSWIEPAAAQPPAGALALPLEASDVVARVAERYAGVDSFRARFKQRVAWYQRRPNTGVVTFARPNKMSWRYANGNRAVSDGTRLLVYEKPAKQMYSLPLGAREQYSAALSFLLAQGQLEQNFTLTKQDANVMKYPTGYVLQGIPLQPNPACERVLFYIDAQTYQVRRVTLIDAQGNRNRFDFVTNEVNNKPPKDEFAFTPPAGTRIIQMP